MQALCDGAIVRALYLLRRNAEALPMCEALALQSPTNTDWQWVLGVLRFYRAFDERRLELVLDAVGPAPCSAPHRPISDLLTPQSRC